ncbi:MAG: hypothetical protein QM626_13880 [Microbacterium sp.]|uniref:hypothetical protein n=1 Tax=Microbacterium sp. TaxID=51671 RepID=UPI0039E4F9E2
MRPASDPRPAEWYRDPDGRGIDAVDHLLDRQILDRDGVPVSTVDDLEIDGVELGVTIDHSADQRVTAVLVGSSLLPRIFGGRMPRSRRERIAWADVGRIGTVVEVLVAAEDLDVGWVERWVRDRVIARIPGGRHAPE